MTVTEDDLRRLLVTEAADVTSGAEFRLRLDTPRTRLARIDASAPRLLGAVAAVAVLLIVVALRGVHTPTPAVPTAPHGELSVHGDADLVATSTQLLADREVLHVAYRPDPQDSYEGGAITLFAPGVFAGRTFRATATPESVRDHPAYLGSYPYAGRVAMVTTLAWPLPDGRWVAVQGFHGTGSGTDPAQNRAADLQVAEAVQVR